MLKRLSLPIILVGLLCWLPVARSAAESYDLILRNGKILDGTGAKGFRADIAVRGGFISSPRRSARRAGDSGIGCHRPMRMQQPRSLSV
jgi:adenine deaminase